MNLFEQFSYVDAQFEHRITKRHSQWKRLLARDVVKLIVEPAQRANCFVTVQRFKDSISNREPRPKDVDAELEPDLFADHQLHYCGPYFDFDARPDKLGISEEECLSLARADAVLVAKYFQERFGFPDPMIQAWFSGKKGFHVTVRPEMFGIQPHRNLTYILQKIALDLVNHLDLKTLDKSVYSIPRMWRIPNTIHHSTGRFKIELSLHELYTEPVLKLKEMSRNPRVGTSEDYVVTGVPASHIWSLDEYKDIGVEKDAQAWFQEYVEQYEAAKEVKNMRPRKKIERPEGQTSYPVCVKDILDNGPKPGSRGRNRVLLPLVSFLKDAGVEKPDAEETIMGWTDQHFGGDSKQLKERRANGLSVIESVYRSPQYAFSCATMLSNKGTGPEGMIACQGDECPWVKNKHDQMPAQVPTLHLAEATSAAYIGTKVQVAVHVSGIGKSPFGFPSKVQLTCFGKEDENGNKEYCTNCPTAKAQGVKPEATFSACERETLALIGVNDSRKKSTVRGELGIPRLCYANKIEELAKGNIEQVQFIPMVDYTQAYANEEAGRLGARHVVRTGYFVGHGIQANKKYVVEAYPFEHPEDQSVVFLFDKAEAAQTDIDQFKMTPDLYRQLLVFQQGAGQSVEDKMKEIHQDLEINVHRIRGRSDMAYAYDLMYHSVIGFRFQGNDINKGWFELLVVGDSGTGKTTMVERVMQHYGVGEYLAGEEARRTGLVYSSQQIGGNWVVIWGKIPQNDRRLLIIDEFAAIPGEEVGKLTQLRSEGKARGQGVAANYETWARTRLIFLTNPRGGRPMADHNNGVDAVAAIFDEHQDLRRTDLAIAARTDDVPLNVLNMRYDAIKLEHRYTSDVCRNMVMWAWSRDPQHIEFTPGTEDRILHQAEVIGAKYACDVYLADRSDMRIKIARIACAVAARLFSTDSEAKKLFVKPEHVDFACKVLNDAYTKRSMGFDIYASEYQDVNHLSDEKTKILDEGFSVFDGLDNLVARLLKINYFSKAELGEQTSYNKEALDNLWAFFTQNQLVERVTRGYKKSAAFTDYLKRLREQRARGEKFESRSTGQSSRPGSSNGNGHTNGNGSKPHRHPYAPPPPRDMSDRDDEPPLPPEPERVRPRTADFVFDPEEEERWTNKGRTPGEDDN